MTLAGFGRSAGAVYRPPIVIVPAVALPPVTLLTLQVTIVFDVPVTEAVNCCVFPKSTVELDDDTDTVTDCAGGDFGVEEPAPHPLNTRERAIEQMAAPRLGTRFTKPVMILNRFAESMSPPIASIDQ